MRVISLILTFAVIVHVKCQLDVHIEDILYGEDDEEDDQEQATSTTPRTRRRPTRIPLLPAPSAAAVAPAASSGNFVHVTQVRERQEPLTMNSTFANITVAPGGNSTNHTFLIKPANNSFFGAEVISSVVGAGAATTERVHYVLGQVGNIWNNVGRLNVTGIVDQALGIRNSQIARPLVTGILNVVFCNPFTFSNNNCQQKRG